jgi:hypothetical protein
MLAEMKVGELRVSAQPPSRLGHAPDMGRKATACQVFLGGDAPIQGAGIVGGLGGVLGHVPGNSFRSTSLAIETLDVHLSAPGGYATGMADLDRPCPLQAGTDQLVRRDGWLISIGAVGPDDGVKVDDASPLELRHPAERQAHKAPIF